MCKIVKRRKKMQKWWIEKYVWRAWQMIWALKTRTCRKYWSWAHVDKEQRCQHSGRYLNTRTIKRNNLYWSSFIANATVWETRSRLCSGESFLIKIFSKFLSILQSTIVLKAWISFGVIQQLLTSDQGLRANLTSAHKVRMNPVTSPTSPPKTTHPVVKLRPDILRWNLLRCWKAASARTWKLPISGFRC